VAAVGGPEVGHGRAHVDAALGRRLWPAAWEGRMTRHGGPWRLLEVIACLNRQSA
jgi:hypothetical protein